MQRHTSLEPEPPSLAPSRPSLLGSLLGWLRLVMAFADDKPSQWHLDPLGPRPFRVTLEGKRHWRAPSMGIDFHLISNFAALALITLAGPAVIFILFYRRGAL